jgi:outer membrane receptor protein involved in Fe transport
MTLNRKQVASAVRLALSLGVVAFAGTSRTPHAQNAGANADPQSQDLDTIVVTGSNVRRVDTETANPVITIDRATIEQSGKLTLGDLVQDLPAVTGPITNPRVNNGGGTGASTVSLRGLGSARTLLLVNGHRYLYGDANAIPAAAVERIEVLTDGASSVYGSDAVGGVVNFILRSNYQGAEFSADYGISDRDDGERKGYHFVFGQTTDKGSTLAGVDYNKFDSVLASSRDFSKNAIYYYYGKAHISGGSGTPGGHIELPPDLQMQFGCNAVTLKALGHVGNPPRLDDFRCYDDATDNYNYQAAGNLELTPQERSSAFVVGNYKLIDNVEAYVEYFHNKTEASFHIAPAPIDTFGTPLMVSPQSYYNPFGVEFSTDAFELKTRSIGSGNRIGNYSTQADQATAGFKGTFADSGWQWNVYFNYGHFKQLNHTDGFINVAKIGPALGPSYRDAAGNIVCGTDPSTGGSGPVPGCVPFDLFDVTDPATIAALDAASGNTFTNVVYAERATVAEANGNLWALPAGTVQLAAGVSYRKQSGQTTPDAAEVPDDAGVCDIGTGCVAPIRGGFDIKEAYAELLIPLLKDLPFASALNLTVGNRYSKYSNFGNTNNTKVAIEYRPIDDLLLRGTVSEVFRAPTISDLYQGNSRGGALAVDPCFGLVGTNAACVGVPGDGSYRPEVDPVTGKPILGNGVATIQSGSVTAGTPIGPEHGKSFDWGFVYDPHWLPGFSLSADLWRVYLDNEIGRVVAQSVLDLCFLANGGPYCRLIHRYPLGLSQGRIFFVGEPHGNLGRVDVKGADMSARYRLAATSLGNFALSFQTTYLDRFADDLAPTLPGDIVQEYAGHYTTGASAIPYANYSRWRALATLSWNRGPWSGAWTLRYVGEYTVGYANLDYNESACLSNYPPGCELKYAASVYHNITAGFDIEPLNARIDIGIDNLSDKSPALIYQNNTINGNVDANTFDTIGRFYWARVTVKF